MEYVRIFVRCSVSSKKHSKFPQPKLIEVQHCVRSFGKRIARVTLLTYSVNGANFVYIFASGQFWLNFNQRSKVYTKLKIVLIKVQVLSKVGIVLFEEVRSTLLPIYTKRIRAKRIIYSFLDEYPSKQDKRYFFPML